MVESQYPQDVQAEAYYGLARIYTDVNQFVENIQGGESDGGEQGMGDRQ